MARVFMLMADLTHARLLPLLLAAVLPAAAAPLSVPLRVNCGGDTIKDKKNKTTWLEDKRFLVSGKKYRFVEEPKLDEAEQPAPPSVYKTVRRASVAYAFRELPDGDYLVRLHFMDGKLGAPRRMDFELEGAHLVRGLDVRKVAGGVNKACIIEVIASVRDGNGLQITGSPGKGDDVFISAIEILAAPPGATPSSGGAFAQRLRGFAGGPVRMVWARGTEPDDFYVNSPTGRLYGYDSEDGGGERCLLSQLRSYSKPLLSPDGREVIFTDHQAQRCFVVRWDGAGLREIAPGYASDVWRDPASGHTWVYVRSGWADPRAPIVRHRLDDPAVKETVWKSTGTGWNEICWFQVNGDGRRGIEALPWPRIGLMDLTDGDFKIIGNGCWPGIAPDSSGRAFYFLGVHTHLEMFDHPKAKPRTINLATVPGWTGHKVYHPRWTNQPRYITVTAPQWMPQTELYLARFDEGYTRVEEWFRLTWNDEADYYGDALLGAPAPSSSSPAPMVQKDAPAPLGDAEAPPSGLVFLWENERAKNVTLGPDGKERQSWSCRLEGRARPGRWFGAELRDGALVPDSAAGPAVAAAARASGALSLVMDVTPASVEESAAGVIASLGPVGGPPDLLITQRGAALEIHAAAGPRPASIPLGGVGSAQWAITLEKDGTLHCHRGGALVLAQPSLAGPPTWKQEAVLVFGNDVARAAPWRGGLEHLAVYDRALTAQEISRLHGAHAARQRERRPVPRVEVEVELLAASAPPELAKLAPYTRSLAENHYRVKKVISGELAAPEIILLEWTVLGGALQPLPSPGAMRRLHIEPVEQHPELEGEHRTTDILDPTLPLFHDPSA